MLLCQLVARFTISLIQFLRLITFKSIVLHYVVHYFAIRVCCVEIIANVRKVKNNFQCSWVGSISKRLEIICLERLLHSR